MPTANTWMLLCLSAAICGTAGCQHTEHVLGIHRCAEIPQGAVPQPLGTWSCEWQHAQTERAEQDDFVIYQYEWEATSTRLGPFGQRHLREIARRLPEVPFPLVIAESNDVELDQSRRISLVESLAALGTPVDPQRVLVGPAAAEPMYGVDVPVVVRSYTAAGGGQGGGGGGGAGGGGGRGAGAAAGTGTPSGLQTGGFF